MFACRRLNHLLLACGALTVASCGGGSDPTKPEPATPVPTAAVAAACTAGAPQPMTSFSASPTALASGDTLTLSWTAPCGFVTIAQKGQTPFILNQPSNGSYQLRAELPGYPKVNGDTTYEATNGDTAPRFDLTVTMMPRATPTPAPAPRSTPTPTPTPTCPAGTSCDDGNLCTRNDKCQSDGKTCTGTAYTCGACTYCNGSGGCTTTPPVEYGFTVAPCTATPTPTPPCGSSTVAPCPAS